MSQFIPSSVTVPVIGKEMSGKSYVFAFCGRDILMKNGELPRLENFPNGDELNGLYVGDLDGVPCLGIPFPEDPWRWSRTVRVFSCTPATS